MNVQIVEHTPNPEKVIAAAAKLCYSSAADVNTLLSDLNENKINSFIEKLMSLGHESPFEHVSFTFAVEGIDRVVSHELVRHRLASYSQRSQRYCSEEKFEYTKPFSFSDRQLYAYMDLVEKCADMYKNLIEEGVPKEDARMILPNATHTRIIFTMNLRSLLHFFNMRCCTRAQWGIRLMANEMLRQCKEISPLLFKHAGASCVNGYCPEGEMSCGAVPTLDKLLDSYHNEKIHMHH